MAKKKSKNKRSVTLHIDAVEHLWNTLALNRAQGEGDEDWYVKISVKDIPGDDGHQMVRTKFWTE